MLLVTGYPKTGNTWLNVMFSYIMNPNSMINGNAKPPNGNIFSHCMPNFNRELYPKISINIPGHLSEKQVVLLIRHPGDTLVSLYMHNVYRERFPMYDGTIDEMVYDDKYGIKKFMMYYKWWWQSRNIPNIVNIIRYEDLLKDTYKVFVQMLNAINLIVPLQTIQDAIEFGKFENMQYLEKTNHLNWPTLYRSRYKDKKACKVREGKIGQYRKLLKSETIEYIDTYVQLYLHSSYGYTSIK